jgi:hypothetical protein
VPHCHWWGATAHRTGAVAAAFPPQAMWYLRTQQLVNTNICQIRHLCIKQQLSNNKASLTMLNFDTGHANSERHNDNVMLCMASCVLYILNT